ncbi:MAG: S41 family peptidase [Bacteroidales bacterium]
MNLDIVTTETIKSLLPKLEKSKAIICDLRGYPKSNPEFITHFLKNDDTVSAWMQVPRIVYPDQERILGYAKYNWERMMKPSKPYLGDKKIVFIIDGSAISYAESYMGYIEGYHLATIVGQPTAGTNGNVNTFDLPGGYSIRFTGMKVLKHNGSQHHGIGILPDIYVNKTIQGIKEGRDEFLEKAIEIAKHNK